jgi:EmrB/QacA subfamily drug resistance transporter
LAASRAASAVQTPIAVDRRGLRRLFGSASPRIVVVAVLGTALAYMSDDMLNLAIPSVARDLDASAAGVQWVLNGYYVPLVAFVLVAGATGDRIGHRRVFRVGLLLFTAGALVSAAAPSVALLTAGRALQGAAAAMVLASGLALVTRLHDPSERDRALGSFFGLTAAVPALGPLLSGALVDLLSWRWLFVVPLVVPVTALLLTARVPETPTAAQRRPDVPGSLSALVALAAASVALIVGPTTDSPWLPWTAPAVAVLAGGMFVRAERRAVDPILPLRLLRRGRLLAADGIWLLGCLTSWGAVFFLAVRLQTALGLRPLLAGLLLTPIYLVMMIGSPLAGALATRVGGRRLVAVGLATYASGLWWLAGVDAATSLPLGVLGPLLAIAVGMATFTAPLAAQAMGALDEDDQGVASGLNNAVGQLAGLLAVIILPAVAGLAGAETFAGPAFDAAYPRALRATAALAAAGLPLAALLQGRHVAVTQEEVPR